MVNIVIMTFVFAVNGHAEDAAAAMERISKEVGRLELGFDDYLLGHKLTEQQLQLAHSNRIAKSVAKTIKFRDDDVFVIARDDNARILGIYKQYSKVQRREVKEIIGEMMLRFNEPTTMAHDKLIYWAYNANGKITQEKYDFIKQNDASNIIATVKFNSTAPIFPDPAPQQQGEQKNDEKAVQEEPADIYIMITSNPLSKIFLAQNR